MDQVVDGLPTVMLTAPPAGPRAPGIGALDLDSQFELADGYEEAAAFFLDLAARVKSDPSIDESLRAVARKACSLLGVERCSVYLREESGGLFRGRVTAAGDDDAEVRKLTCGGPADGFTRDILEHRGAVFITDCRRDSRPVRSAIQNWGVVSMLGVPLIADGDVVGVLFLDDPARRREFSADQLRLAESFGKLAGTAIQHLQRTEALRAATARIGRQNRVLRHHGELEDRLLRLSAEGSTMEKLTTAIAEVTDSVCAIYGPEGNRLACAGPPAELGRQLHELLDREAARGSVARALAAVGESGEPAVVDVSQRGRARAAIVAAPLLWRGESWGHLLIVGGARATGLLDAGITRRVAAIASFGLAASDRAVSAESQAREALAGDLLLGRTPARDLRQRAQFHGLQLDRQHVVVVFRPGAGQPSLDAESVTAAFARDARDGARPLCVGGEDGTVLALVELPEATPAAERGRRTGALLDAVVGALGPAEGELLAAASLPCMVPGDCQRALGEAKVILNYLGAIRGESGRRVLIGEELGLAELLLVSGDPRDSERLAIHVLEPLLDEGGDCGPDLLWTLATYFDCCRNIRKAAEELGIHENTVRYRLSRASKITGRDLIADAEAQLSAQVAVAILRLRGLLPEQEDLA